MKITIPKHTNLRTQSLFVLLAVAFVVLLFSPRDHKFMYNFERGQVWQYELLIAPYDITILKPQERLQAERDSVARNILPYCRMDKSVAKEKILLWNHDYTTRWKKELSPEVEVFVRNYLEETYDHGIIDDALYEKLLQAKQNEDEEGPINEVNLLYDQNESRKHPTTLFLTVKEAYQQAIDRCVEAGYNPDILRRINLENYLRANVSEDVATRNNVIREEQKKISNSTGIVVAGRRIIDKGDIIDDATYNVLASYKKMYEERSGNDRTYIGRIGGLLLIVVVLLLGLWLYWIIFRPAIFRELKNTVFIAASILFFVLLTELTVTLFQFDVYIIPYLILPLLVRIFFDSRTAYFSHTITILLSALFVALPLEFIILEMVAGMVAIFSLSNLTSRSQLIRTTFLAFLSYSILSVALSLMRNGALENADALHTLSFGINMIFLMFTYVLVYPMEKLFGYISNISLVELSDINRPLLRQLSEHAPGTFQHSMQVSILATDAAQSINADVQLTRTGALYHDIGKMLNAPFFTENNQGGRNPHEDLSYKESAAIIIKHVTEGVALAQKYNLPPQVIDFIRTHHGKGYTKYFYTMYCNEHPGEIVDLAPFSYPGPNPFSRETGILMLADAVEASSRSLKEYTVESITSLVERIVDGIVSEKLLDNTPLTLREITTIKETFVNKLLTMNHSRIAYPKLNREEAPAAPQNEEKKEEK